jgi:hypothetical protein
LPVDVDGDRRETWLRLRWPLLALALAGILLATSFALDAGSERQRDLALLIGAPTVWLLLPASTIWTLVAAIRYLRRRHGAASRRRD